MTRTPSVRCVPPGPGAFLARSTVRGGSLETALPCLQMGIITTKNKRAEKLSDLAGESRSEPAAICDPRRSFEEHTRSFSLGVVVVPL